MNNHSAAVKVSNLRLKFPGEQSLMIKDLSLTIPQGQKVLLLGPSGCGKSTLLQVLSGIIPHSIEIPLKYDEIQLPESWGFVFQDPDTQFCMPFVDEELAFVLENLSIPRAGMELYIQNALASVGLMLEDLHTPIDTLSQGMKQRLALASVLLLEPEVLFLDEPSALLDPEGTVDIWDTVKSIAASKTIIIVEHKIDQIVDLVDRVVLFNKDGQIIADDTPKEVFDKYKHELIEFGIWYPSVWDDYIRSSVYHSLQEKLFQERTEKRIGLEQMPVISLQHFSGLHGDVQKVHIREADIYPGEWIAVIGSNGAGKSTLLLSLMQLLRTEGTYRLLGELIEQKTKRKRRQAIPKQLSFVFQNPEMQFITNSVYEEVAYSRQFREQPGQIELEVRKLLVKFGLNDLEERHPYQLSMGQKRRLSIASAMIQEQQILLLDEPTFGQDARNTFVMLEMIEDLRAQGITIIMVTHDNEIMKHFATKIWTIDEGQLVDIRPSERGESNGILHTSEANVVVSC